MKLALISFTQHGSRLNEMVSRALSLQGYDCDSYAMKKYAPAYGLKILEEPLKEWTGKMFREMDAILFIGATGIAVRSIAPFVQSKTKDPAIVVMDEKGVFAISLMSGHLGGANELTGVLANLTGAIPVITTATDVNGKFAVDVFARKNGLYISNMKYAKEISADVLDEKKIGFYTDYPVIGRIPEELEIWEEDQVFEGTNGICVSVYENKEPYKQTLHLIPRILTVGVGCKKGTPADRIREKIQKVLTENHISEKSISRIASIDLKAEEKGLIETAKELNVEFLTYTSEELKKVKGDFTESAFVASVTGVSNVCERSAVLGSNYGVLICPKNAGDGVTVALALQEYMIDFTI
mgnify:CR=1 FL=1